VEEVVWGLLSLWPFWVFGFISGVVVDCACCRDCTVGAVGQSGDSECVGERGSVVTV
jgi:hypothetical protein